MQPSSCSATQLDVGPPGLQGRLPGTWMLRCRLLAFNLMLDLAAAAPAQQFYHRTAADGRHLPRLWCRIPIVVTGNDFSTLFAPLVRDGRMDKFYWKPGMEDLVPMLHQVGR